MAAINGGRVDFVTPRTDYKNVAVRQMSDPLYTVQKQFTPTPLIRAYFSHDNMNVLQSALKNRILDKSGGKFVIGKQSETDLVVVMRSVYCMFSRNLLTTSVREQIRELNEEVLQMIVPDVYSRILGYLGYRRDVASNAEGAQKQTQFLDRGVSTSGPGRKVLTYPLFQIQTCVKN